MMKLFQILLAVVAIASVSAKGVRGAAGDIFSSTADRSTDSKNTNARPRDRPRERPGATGSDRPPPPTMNTEDPLLSAFASASGAQEVPAIDSDTSAQLVFDVSNDLSSIAFKLTIQNGVDITQAHLHCAPAGVNGAILVFLFPLVADNGGVDVDDGTLNEGSLTNADLLGVECEGVVVSNISTLVEFILQRRIYLNVHSLSSPSGEIRGQIFASY
mmetsp:Transcript_8620/g.14330  ORF Transcript_8620/g.14330 Transcript_8620/m.14330 type:complete len:216 (+) Transcript_8620:78-725(+)